MKNILPFLIVGVGGFVGSVLRYSMTVIFNDFSSLPYGTFISNCAGCLLIGIIAGVASTVPNWSNEANLFFATGICGGFTTLSSLVFECNKLTKDDHVFLASLYLLGTLIGSFGTFIIGFFVSKFLGKLIFVPA